MSLKGFVNHPLYWESFLKEIDNQMNVANNKLHNANTTEEIFRLQGEIKVYKRLKNLRHRVNNET